MKQVKQVMMISCLIASFVIVFLWATRHSYAIAGVPVEPAKITIRPEIPTVTEPIQIVVAGIWSDGCSPFYVTHEISATTILISAALPEPDVICGQAVTPWSITVDLAPLSAEHYQVEVGGAVSVSSTVSVTGNLVYLPAVRSE